MTSPQDEVPSILYLDSHLIAVCKPAGMLTQADDSGDESLMDQVKAWIKTEFNKPGNVFLGLIHRLDRNVSGVLLFARTSKGASRLSEQFRDKTTEKFYRAIVEGHPEQEQASLYHHLIKDITLESTVFPLPGKDTQHAELEYKTLKNYASTRLLEIKLHTGRFHQIRAQLAFIGHPILGDKKYGAKMPLPERQIALYAHRLIFKHPISKEKVCIESPPPPFWPDD